jgi:hypothetical protein
MNQGQGQFGAPKLLANGSVGGGAGDFNGDGKADLVVLDYGKPSQLDLLLGDGAGGFAAQPGLQTGIAAALLTVGDLNGDKKPDVVTGSITSVDVFLGGGPSLMAAGSYPVQQQSGPQPVAVGDWNGDGKLDLAAGNLTAGLGGQVTVLAGQGDGTLTAPVITSLNGASYLQSLVGADWDRDGKIDLAVSDFGNSVFVLVGAGDGTFTARRYDSGGQAGALAAADLNGDGKPDLVIVNLYAGQVSVLLNTLP